MKPYKYSGELGRYTENKSLLPAIVRGRGNAAAMRSEVTAAKLARFDYLSDLLFDQFGIDRLGPDRWFDLAIELVFLHVPAFTYADIKKAGRPRKVAVSYLARMNPAPARLGRKPYPKRDEYLRAILDAVSEIKARNGMQGRGSDKRALVILTACAAGERKPSRKTIQKIPALQKKLSEARKKKLSKG